MIKQRVINEEINLTQPFNNDPENSLTDTNDADYKEMILEMHRFAKRQTSSYNWDNLQ